MKLGDIFLQEWNLHELKGERNTAGVRASLRPSHRVVQPLHCASLEYAVKKAIIGCDRMSTD